LEAGVAGKDVSNDRRKDKTMAHRIATGDRSAFAEFVDLFGPRIQALTRRYTSSHADAEDLTQEIFLDLYRSIGTFRGGSALSTWVYRVALNHCLKHCERKPAATVELDEAVVEARASAGADPCKSAASSELRDQVHGALDGLSPEHRNVVILHELQELTYSECASILNVPIGTVKSRLYYAFCALRRTLAAYVVDDPFALESGAGQAGGAAAETIG
jgi:RNA polymerase sigma-70 factor, ECF subfamily